MCVLQGKYKHLTLAHEKHFKMYISHISSQVAEWGTNAEERE